MGLVQRIGSVFLAAILLFDVPSSLNSVWAADDADQKGAPPALRTRSTTVGDEHNCQGLTVMFWSGKIKKGAGASPLRQLTPQNQNTVEVVFRPPREANIFYLQE
jgi:hypothetical protein